MSNSFRPDRSVLLAAPLAAVAIAVSIATLIASGPGFANQQTFAQKYVTVVGLEGRPVTGLGSEDFSLRDGAVRRPVQAAEPATQPLAIGVVMAGFESAATPPVAQALEEVRRVLSLAGAGHRVDVVDAGARPFLDAALEASNLVGAASTDRRIVQAARVARLLLSQYVVTYAWPDPMIGQFSISTRHDRGTVLSPVWDR